MLKRNVFTLLGTRSSSCKIGSKWKNSDLHHISNQRPTLFQFSTPLFSNVSYFPRGREHSVFIPSIISNTKSFRTSITTSHTAQSRFSMFQRNMFINTEPTPNPDSLKFMPQHPVQVLGEGKNTVNFPNAREAFSSPLAKELFKLNGVKGVMLGADFLTVTKSPEINWSDLRNVIFAIMSDFYATGLPIIDRNAVQPPDTAPKPEDSEVVAMIKEIIDTRIRPAVQEDGGDIVFKTFQDGVVFLKMQGSCSGCPSSSVTLKSGIERMLMHWVPEVTGVVAVDDEELEKLNLEQFKKTEQNTEQAAQNVEEKRDQ